MPRRNVVDIPERDAVIEGYHLAVVNATRLFAAAQTLVVTNPPVALAIAQLGQEEAGKSFLLLAAIGLRPQADGWSWFWRQWRNHRLKAHRAYLYEILNPQRLEFDGEGGVRRDGRPLRDNIAREKEEGFYVDYFPAERRFKGPSQLVTEEEAWSRSLTLGYLTLTASAVHDALIKDDIDFRAYSFSEIAYRCCTERIFQQDFPAIVLEFANRSPRHLALVRALDTEFEASRLRP